MKYFTILLIPVILVSGLFFITSCEEDSNAPSETTSFSGKIVDNQQLGVINATVEALNSSNRVLLSKTITDENGNFTLDKLPVNFQSVIIKISHPDYVIYEQNLNSFKEKTANGSTPFILTDQDSCCGRFSAVVEDSATGNKLNDVEVRLTKNGDLVKKTYTNSNGEVSVQPLCPGEYVARIYKEGYYVIEKVFNIEECDTANFEFSLKSRNSSNSDSCCHGVLYVVLKDKTSGERMNGKVKIGKNGTVTAWKETIEGVVKFDGLCPGEYVVWAASEGYQTQEFQANFECNDTLEVARQLERTVNNDSCCNGKIIIVVKDQSGNALNGASVKLTKNDQVIGNKTLDLNVARFENLCEGTYWVRVAREGYQTQEFQVQLDCNEVEELVRNLESINNQDSCCDGRLEIIVKDQSGNAINGASVKLVKNDQVIGIKTPDGNIAVWESLCQGTYWVRIAKDGYQVLEFEIGLDCNQNKEIVKILTSNQNQDSCCDGRIKLVVKDKNTGSVISGATVKLWKGGTLVATKTLTGDYVVFERVCKGTYGMNISAEGYQGIEFQVELGCNETVYLTKELQSNNASDTCYTAILKLAVKDSTTSLAISGATIRIYLRDDLVADGQTNAEGYFAKENLMAPAEYRVVISKDGYVTKAFEFYFNECKKIAETVRLTPQ